MTKMRVLLSEIDQGAELWPTQVSVGEVTYPPGGRLGPRWQRDVQLVLVHSGSARIAIDDEPRATQRAGAIGLLLPGHRERFAFADGAETHHSWIQGRVPDLSASLAARLAALPVALPASTALTELIGE